MIFIGKIIIAWAFFLIVSNLLWFLNLPSILFFQSVEKGARPGKNLKARVRNPPVDRFSLLQRLWLRLGTLLRSGNSHF